MFPKVGFPEMAGQVSGDLFCSIDRDYSAKTYNSIIGVCRTKGVDGEAERIKLFEGQVRKAKQMSRNLMFLGDMNIGMLESRDQINKSNTCRTMPIYTFYS